MLNFQSLWSPNLAPVVIVIILLGVSTDAQLQNWLLLYPDSLWTQPWRIITTHLVHLNPTHLSVNIAAFVLLMVLFRDYLNGRLLINVMIIAAVFASLVPVWLAGNFHFAGLSGVLHGMLAYIGLQLLQVRRTWGIWILAALVAKLVVDLLTAGQEVSWLGAEVAYLSHIGGALGGILAFPGLRRQPKDLLPKRLRKHQD